MLGEYQDETDSKNGHSSSLLEKLKHKVMPHRRHRSASKDSSTEGRRGSAVSTFSESSEFETTAIACTVCSKSCPMERPCKCGSSSCVGDSDKFPGDKTVVHIMSSQLGLLRVTDEPIGKDDAGNPIYKVDCKGEDGNQQTNLVLYEMYPTKCVDCKRCYFHVLDPADSKKSSMEGARVSTSLDEYTYRLCRYEKESKYVLAAHKAAHATPKFDTDPDALIDVCYHASKGGTVTLQANSSSGKPLAGLLWKACKNGEVCPANKSKFPGYCTNPLTLFNMYDEVDDYDEQETDLKRMNGEK